MSAADDHSSLPNASELHAQFDRMLPHHDGRRRMPVEVAKALIAALEVMNRPLRCLRGKLRCYNPETGCMEVVIERALLRLVLELDLGEGLRTNHFASDVGKAVRVLAEELPDDERRAKCIALPNGTLVKRCQDGRDRIEFVEGFDSSYACVERVPIAWQPNGSAEEIWNFLAETLPENAIALVLGLVGLALVGDGAKLHRSLIFYGTGANGKGVLCELLRALFPPRAVAALPPDEMLKDYGRVALSETRLNVVSEFDGLSPRVLTEFKKIVAGDVIHVRSVGGNGFSLRPEALHILCTNSVPNLGARSEALQRRFLTIPFRQTVPLDKRDPYLSSRLKAFALPGLLKLCIESANELYGRMQDRDPFADVSDDVQAATDLLFRPDQTVAAFVEAFVVKTGDQKADRVPASAMYAAYVAHSNRAGSKCLSDRAFKREMERLGLSQVTSNGVKWVGVALRPECLERPEGNSPETKRQA